MPLTGAPDFQAQTVPTNTVLASQAVNSLVPVNVDITSLVQPYHQAVQFFWIASGAYLGFPALVTLSTSLGTGVAIPQTAVGDSATVVAAYPFLRDIAAGATLTLTIGPAGGGAPATITGTLIAIASSLPPSPVMSPRLNEIGKVTGTGLVTCNASAVTLVMPAPNIGEYHRIKGLGFHFGAAVAAVNAVDWIIAGTRTVLYEAQVANGQSVQLMCDFATDQAISLQNVTGTACTAAVLYERWPV